MNRDLWFIVAVLLVLSGWHVFRCSTACRSRRPRSRCGAIREFVDEQAKTRLPQTYLITMPFTGRIEAIELTEGHAR